MTFAQIAAAKWRLQEVTRKMLGDVLATENDDDDDDDDDDDKTAATASIS